LNRKTYLLSALIVTAVFFLIGGLYYSFTVRLKSFDKYHALHQYTPAFKVFVEDAAGKTREITAFVAQSINEPNVGVLENRWQLLAHPFESVARCRLSSGGKYRDGVWAHGLPGGAVIVIELSHLQMGKHLVGYFGLTDRAVLESKNRNISDQIEFKVSVNGTLLYEKNADRKEGWKEFKVPAAKRGMLKIGGDKLSVRIKASNPWWTQFVFNIWSE